MDRKQNIFPVMEVASGEYSVDLIKAAQMMTQFKPEPEGNGSWEIHIPSIPALPSPLGMYSKYGVCLQNVLITLTKCTSAGN